VTARLTATDLAVVATMGPDRGRMRITVDGRPKDIDLYAPTLRPRVVVWSAHLGPRRLVDVRIEVLGTSDERSAGVAVELDALVTLR
jgi:hypothetical protein